MVVISEFFYPCAFGKERVLSRRWPVVKPRRFEVAINVLAELLLSGTAARAPTKIREQHDFFRKSAEKVSRP